MLARHPLPRPDGTILLGTAPLPDDYVPPAEVALDIEEMFSKGMRGRQIAYQLAGLEYRTSKQSMQDNKHLLAGRKSEPEAEKKVASGSKVADGQGKGKTGKGKQKAASTSTPKTSKVKREGQGAADVAPLIRVLVENDGEGEMPIPKSDLKALRERWGSRVRIRCTDQEIYYRLTGSHQQVSGNYRRGSDFDQLAWRKLMIEAAPDLGASALCPPACSPVASSGHHSARPGSVIEYLPRQYLLFHWRSA